jgi:adenylate cyclase
VIHFAPGGRVRAEKKRLLQRQVSPAAMRKIQRSPELLDLSAQTRTLSFLVCRIRGFSDVAESFAGDPEGLSSLVRRAMTPMVQAVYDRGGTLNRMLPGGLSAFFNAPLEDPDHALHACECALAMLQALEKVNRALEQGRHPDGTPFDSIAVGIGLNTGAGIVGDFGTEEQPDYAAVGRSAEFADEIERLSGNYGTAIIAGAATQTQAERSFAFLEVDVLPKEKGEPLPLFALLGTPLSRANPKFLALKAYHEHIFQAYRAQEWAKARTLIAQCRSLSGANPVLYDLYLQRIEHYETDPPPANWDGIFTPAHL